MPKLINILAITYGIALTMLIGNIVLKLNVIKYNTISPLNEGFSVFALSEKGMPKKNYRIYGFLPYWKLNETKYLQYENLTDIVYFALSINEDGTIRKIDYDGTTEPGYNNWKTNPELDQIIKKSKENNVNFALSIISHDDDISDEFLDCRKCWDTLIKEVKVEMKSKDIKDLNLDFEYVGSPEEDKTKKYTEFSKLLNIELDKEFGNSIVTVATFVDSQKRPRITNPEELVKVIDYIFVMAYDFHYRGSERAGPLAPIVKTDGYTGYDISTMLKDHMKVIPPEKMILGVGYYGYNWLVTDPVAYATRVDGNDFLGYSTSETYEGIMNKILDERPVLQWDASAQSPYFTYASQNPGFYRVVYFENKDSLKAKYELVKHNKLGGVGIWALGYDGGYQELWDLLRTEFVN